MSNSEKIILVTGATGQQGGAVAKNLLEKGWAVRAMTRNPEGEKALALKSNGVEVVKADMSDSGTLTAVLDGVYGVFSVQNFWESGYDGEVTQGKTLADAAKAADVKHFVYSSVASADKNTDLSHFDSKFEIEEYIRNIELPYTIVRPVFFMENFYTMKEYINNNNFMNSLLQDVPLQMIAVNDIGRIVAQAFEAPDKYIGKSIDLAGDSVTFPKVAELFSKETGKDISFSTISLEDFQSAMGEEYAKMFDWFNKVGYDVNIDELESSNDIKLVKLEEWIPASGW
ncbi:MAG: NmrA/HSCARG family protein [Candidatus Marinimicrobia bacterium]|nr:NmrA/HSCARG family protein [Candidatus Neomarinimicrobiota bacterium]